ncbi:hypothetical protein BD779DRAFT_1535146 [Infundibulicybe gibba]|nr:hypothetical protein BD779DRAFT_1535146 [Infundibulicybe gibba]
MIWAVRISGFLLFRVLKTGSDTRFDHIRSHFFKFLGFWVGQIVWVWTVSLPVVILNSPAVSDTSNQGSDPTFGTSRDIAGVVLWALGLFIEATADIQKYKYKASKSRPKDQPMRKGLWAWSRHPPYFGEMMCWWGIWILCLSPSTNGSIPGGSTSALYGAIVSPIFTVLLLMFASGVPTAEKPQAKRYYLMSHGSTGANQYLHAWPSYKSYVEETSILIPLPPALYRPLPTFIKQTLLLDFPIYRFDENEDGRLAIEEASN